MTHETENLISLMHQIRKLVLQLKPQSDITFGEYCVLSTIQDYNYLSRTCRNPKI